jgi:hypothetical protein
MSMHAPAPLPWDAGGLLTRVAQDMETKVRSSRGKEVVFQQTAITKQLAILDSFGPLYHIFVFGRHSAKEDHSSCIRRYFVCEGGVGFVMWSAP